MQTPPIIFLLGPPGVGKSTLGSRAARELGLGFQDLAASELERLARVIADRPADVVELPWKLQHERQVLALVRKSGVPLLLWAHPQDMQARSGRDAPLFTPVPRLKIRGGFGRNGTGCREFRHLDRACGETLLLVDLPLEEAVEAVRECIAEIRAENDATPAEREGLSRWVDEWRQDHSASPRVTKVIVDAMARYLAHLRATGTSPRTLSCVRSDLNAVGHLVLMYDAPKGSRILVHFDGPQCAYEFERKFTDSPALVARYRRSRPQRLVALESEVCSLLNEYQNWLDNMPENLAGSSLADELQEVIEQLQPVADGLAAIEPPRIGKARNGKF